MGTKAEFSDDGKAVRLLEPIQFRTKSGKLGTVPVGFESDLASVPRFFRRVFPKMDKHYRAAIIHDWLCKNPWFATKLDADETFLHYMKAGGVEWWKRALMYAGVRLYSPFRKGE